MKISFYGLGIMGSRMAANLLSSDADLMVYNRTASKAKPLAEAGATVAESPQQLAEHADILITMLATPEAVKETATGDTGFLNFMESGSLWVDCSTVNPSFSRKMASKADRHDVRFMDAPAAGSKAPAESGDLLFLVGGDESDVELCTPYFKTMGRDLIHAGEAGRGTALKMVFNLLLGEAMEAFAEGMHLGESLGFNQDMLLETLVGSPVVAPFISAKKDKIAQQDFEADFPLKWMQKDLELASQTAYETNAALPAGNVIKELFAMAKQEDMGEQDFSAIYSFLRNQDS